MEVVTCIAPVNIATIKYWGKRDESLILPLNDSISVTLSTDQMNAKTSAVLSSQFNSDKLWLNGIEQPIDSSRFTRLITEIRKRTNNELASLKVHICSENNFPTAAGLASSAAGYACLVYTLSKLYKLNGDISPIARMGSGSACRSVYGGFVRWHTGKNEDGSDSIAEQLFPAEHWPELHIIILVVTDTQKKVASTSGMKQTAVSSQLFKHRINETVPKNAVAMIKAIKERNFSAFADLTMRDSNQMHATCLDTFPPVVYMNDVSHAIVNFIHNYNKLQNETKVAYTFDAGPNACLFLLEKDVNELISHLFHVFPTHPGTDNYVRGIPVNLKQTVNVDVPSNGRIHEPGLIKYIIHTKVGEGPSVLTNQQEHLINSNGFPKNFTV